MLLQVFNYAIDHFRALEDLVVSQPVCDEQLAFLQFLTYGNGTAYMDEAVITVVDDQDGYPDPLGPVLGVHVVEVPVVPFLEQALKS